MIGIRTWYTISNAGANDGADVRWVPLVSNMRSTIWQQGCNGYLAESVGAANEYEMAMDATVHKAESEPKISAMWKSSTGRGSNEARLPLHKENSQYQGHPWNGAYMSPGVASCGSYLRNAPIHTFIPVPVYGKHLLRFLMPALLSVRHKFYS